MPSKLSIEHAHEAARTKNGLCLSEVYENAQAKLRWKCMNGHEWEATLNHIRSRGDWCVVCSGRKKKTLEDLREFARSKGGVCLAQEYKNIQESVRWRCAEGHEWCNSFGNVVSQNQWCRDCSKLLRAQGEHKQQRRVLAELQEFAKAKGGKCLSTIYSDYGSNLEWQCAEKHEWKATPHNIKAGKWCPDCYRARQGQDNPNKLSLEIAQQDAERNGGKCLSLEYKNTSSPMEWECAMGHQWTANLNHIRSGTWCPQCLYKGEEETRVIFEELTGRPFVRCRNILVSHPRYELDGYNKELRIAFEHHGGQHYKFVPHFHKNGIKDFETQQRIDAERREACEKEDIYLIEVPHYVNKYEFIMKALDGII